MLRCSHKEIQFPPTPQLASGAMALSQGLMVMPAGGSWFRYAASHVTPGQNPEAEQPFDGTRNLPDFWEGEGAGRHTSPRLQQTQGLLKV